MNIENAARGFAELGHPIRLQILRELVQAGPEGLPVNTLKEALDCPGSTLSHHLSRLCSVNLVRQVRVSRELRCHIDFEALQTFIDFLYQECCKKTETPCC